MEFLIECADRAIQDAVRARLGTGLAQARPAVAGPREATAWLIQHAEMPSGLVGWLLEQDDPEINAVLFRSERVPAAALDDIQRGIPYRPGRPAKEIVPFRGIRHGRSVDYRVFDPEEWRTAFDQSPDPRGLVGELRRRGEARQLAACRAAAAAVGREDWDRIAATDRREPLPGYARWALCVHPLCPPELRSQLGGDAPVFAKRIRGFGIYRDSAELVAHGGRAHDVSGMLDCGRFAFPNRLAAARDLLRPTLARALGANLEAWAVLAQLLPSFAGTLPALIATSAAIGAGAP